MPLIVVSGLPSSGKSTIAAKLCEYIKAQLREENDARQVKVVSDSEILDWDGRDNIYTSIPKEKELRGWLKSEIQRFLGLNQIVILDAAVYIKGLRYEIYCIAKEAKTQYCVMECLIDQSICWSWNEKVRQDNKSDPNRAYSRDTFDALIFRYEKCEQTNRWDSPLFRLDDIDKDLYFSEIYNILTKHDPLAPNKCTSLSSTTETIYKQKKS